MHNDSSVLQHVMYVEEDVNAVKVAVSTHWTIRKLDCAFKYQEKSKGVAVKQLAVWY